MTSPGRYVLGIDIGGTNIKLVRVSLEGKIFSRESVRTFAEQEDWPQRVRERVGLIETEYKSAPEAIAIAAPGIPAPDGQSIWWMQGRLAEIEGLDWTKFLQRRSTVRVFNDAQAALTGEVWQGAAKGCRNVVLLTLGTGVGGAAMVDGRVLRGHLGRAGHLGHICLDVHGRPDLVGTPGSLEEAVGECGVAHRSGGRYKSVYEFLMGKSDPDATRAREEYIRALACGITSLVNVLDPEIVVIGGGVVHAGAWLFDALRAELEKVEWRPHGRTVRIVPAKTGEYAGALGAAYEAIQSHESR